MSGSSIEQRGRAGEEGSRETLVLLALAGIMEGMDVCDPFFSAAISSGQSSNVSL